MCREFQLGYHSMVHIGMLVSFLGQRMRSRSLNIQNGDNQSFSSTHQVSGQIWAASTPVGIHVSASTPSV